MCGRRPSRCGKGLSARGKQSTEELCHSRLTSTGSFSGVIWGQTRGCPSITGEAGKQCMVFRRLLWPGVGLVSQTPPVLGPYPFRLAWLSSLCPHTLLSVGGSWVFKPRAWRGQLSPCWLCTSQRKLPGNTNNHRERERVSRGREWPGPPGGHTRPSARLLLGSREHLFQAPGQLLTPCLGGAWDTGEGPGPVFSPAAVLLCCPFPSEHAAIFENKACVLRCPSSVPARPSPGGLGFWGCSAAASQPRARTGARSPTALRPPSGPRGPREALTPCGSRVSGPRPPLPPPHHP